MNFTQMRGGRASRPGGGAGGRQCSPSEGEKPALRGRKASPPSQRKSERRRINNHLSVRQLLEAEQTIERSGAGVVVGHFKAVSRGGVVLFVHGRNHAAADALAALFVVHHDLLQPDAQAAGLVRPGERKQTVAAGRAVVVLGNQAVRVGRAVHEQLEGALGVLRRNVVVAGGRFVERMAAVDEEIAVGCFNRADTHIRSVRAPARGPR